jgi:hypothetical protein
MALEHSVSLIKQKAKEKGEKEKGIAYAESQGGRGKIRYIGGWCVRSISVFRSFQKLIFSTF